MRLRLQNFARLSICLALPLLSICTAQANEGQKPAISGPAFNVIVKGSGRPMILIPGLSCGGEAWEETVEHFKNGYQCHVITLAGFAGQPAIGEPFLQQVRDGLRDYIREQKLEKPVLIGHSLGGFLSLWLGIENSDLVGPIIAVDGVPYHPALNDSATNPEAQRPMAEKFRTFIGQQKADTFRTMNRRNLSVMITDPAKLKKVADQADKSDPKAVGLAIYELMVTDVRSQLPTLKSSVLLIAATDAQASAKEQERQAEAYRLQMTGIPTHKVIFAPKSRHFIQLDQPKFFIREVESFLRDTPQ